MSISENISRYRKKKGYTQEQLGRILGVSNQAVSKWESAVSMPDVMLLPEIAKALGITLDELYGIEREEPEAVSADDSPKAANDMLIEYFKTNSKTDFHSQDLEDPWSLLCLSDVEGGCFISKGFTLLDCMFKRPEEAEVFLCGEVLSALKKLSDRKVSKVLAYMYGDSFGRNEKHTQSYTQSQIMDACGLSEDDALDALETLCVLHILEPDDSGQCVEYAFLKFRAFLALSVFKTVKLLIKNTFCYEICRDTSQITDYTFGKAES